MYAWRGLVGLVKPTYRAGSLERFIRLMPDGVGVIPRYVGVRTGSEKEFQEALAVAEEKVAELADLKVDLVVIQGVPPIMLRGYAFDAELVEKLQRKYGVPVLTATRTQVEALQALKIRRLVGLTYFKDDLNPKFASFFEEGGFEVAAMKGLVRKCRSRTSAKSRPKRFMPRQRRSSLKPAAETASISWVPGGIVSPRLSRWSGISGPSWLPM